MANAASLQSIENPDVLLGFDVHLQMGAWPARPEIRGDALYSLSQLYDYALFHPSVRLVILPGDVSDIPNPDQYLIGVLHQLSSLLFRTTGAKTVYVKGQHDQSSAVFEDPRLELSKALTSSAGHQLASCLARTGSDLWIGPQFVYLHRETLQLESGVTIAGLDFDRDAERYVADLKHLAGADVLITHNRWTETVPRGKGGVSLQHVPPGMLLWSGDYHVHQVKDFAIPGRSSSLRWFSPGSSSMQEVSEEPRKSFFAIRTSDMAWQSVNVFTRWRLRIEDASIAPRQAANLAIMVADDCATLPPVIRKPIVRFGGNFYPHQKEITSIVEDRCHIWFDPAVDAGVDAEFERLLRSSGEAASDWVHAAVAKVSTDAGLSQEIHSMATEILDSKDYQAEIGRMAKEVALDQKN